MNRYLINISYIGTAFRGMQKTVNKSEGSFVDYRSVQGCIEVALEKLHPVNNIELVLSSRTDAGVHALKSSVHVDLEAHHGHVFLSESVTSILNKHFSRQNLKLRVINTIQVPSTFHCRYNAQGRTYVYRLAVAKESLSKSLLRTQGYVSFVPIEEIQRCYFLQESKFDIQTFKQTAELFIGLHDFRTFMKSNKRNERQDRPHFTLRTIENIKIESGQSYSSGISFQTAQPCYDYFNITIRGKSFLHNQIRRMIGCMIGVATGRITKKDVYEMLTIPSKHMWNPRVAVAPPFALYLCEVHYDGNDFELLKGNQNSTSN